MYQFNQNNLYLQYLYRRRDINIAYRRRENFDYIFTFTSVYLTMENVFIVQSYKHQIIKKR